MDNKERALFITYVICLLSEVLYKVLFAAMLALYVLGYTLLPAAVWFCFGLFIVHIIARVVNQHLE